MYLISNMTDRSCNFSESKIILQPFECKETIKSIDTFLELFYCCYGPNSRLNAFQNCNGGKVTLTSTLIRTLKHISIHTPEARIITTVLNGYCSAYKEGSHFAGILGLKLMKTSLELRKEIHPKLICNVLEFLCEECVVYLKSENCKTKKKLDLSSIADLQNVIKSVFNTKPLVKSYSEKLSSILLEGFIKTLENSYNLIFATEKGRINESRLLDGLYVRYHGNNKFKNTLKGKIIVVNESMSGDDFNQNSHQLK